MNLSLQFLRALAGLLVILLMGNTVQAQFRSNLRKAEKQYELSAFNLAVPNYQKALERRPNDMQALTHLADCYRYLNEMEKADSIYRLAALQQLENPEDQLRFAHVLKAIGDYEQARHWYATYSLYDEVTGNHYVSTCDFAEAQLQTPSAYQVVNEPINSFSSDFGPTFLSGELVYASSRTDIQRPTHNWTGKANNQLYVAQSADAGYLMNPALLETGVVDQVNYAPASFNPQGNEVIFTKNNFVDGTRHISGSGMILNLYTAQINAIGQWVNITPYMHNGSEFNTGWASYSPDGQAIYFASDRPGGYGGFDIYVSFKNGVVWTTPENMGPIVNSPGDEISPFYDGSMLYFSSDWHPGMGGYDIFRASAEEGRFNRIFHLGNVVNSSRDDYGFIYKGETNRGYFASNRPGGKGAEDLYMVSRISDSYTIRVTNASDGAPLAGVTIDMSRCGGGAYQTDINGSYQFQSVSGYACELMISKEGYTEAMVKLNADNNNLKEYDISLARVGETYPGTIIDYSTGSPLAGVFISATNTESGASSNTRSDLQGNYVLALSPNTIYVVRFSQSGYQDINMTVHTEVGADRSQLGTITLAPIGTDLGTTNPSEPSYPGGSTTPTQPGYPSDNPDIQTLEGDYAVQLAAISQPNVSQFTGLEDMGAIYTVKENNRFKVRLGPFVTAGEAEHAQAIAKQRGYLGAFVVSNKATPPSPPAGGGYTPPLPDEPTTTGGYGDFKVQLAAYSKPQYFDARKVAGLGGVVEERMKGALTVKYLAGFNSASEAEAVLPQLRSAGFKGAFIVQEVNGELIKVQ